MSWRFNVVLLIFVIASALSLIKAQYQARQLFIELGRVQDVSKQLALQTAQLQLEQSSLIKHARIEALVKRNLKMSPPSVGRTQYLTLKKVERL